MADEMVTASTAMIYAVYTFAFLLSLIVLLPYFAFLAIRQKKYVSSLGQRLRGPVHIQHVTQPIILVHAVSVGETLAVQPLVQRLHDDARTHRLIISTTTETGQAVARRRFADQAQVIYFPLDFGFSVRRTLDKIVPSLVLIAETEIWPNFLRICSQRGLPVILVNGRISDRSFARYSAVRPFMARALNQFSWLLMQSQRDADRVLHLGARPDRVVMIGNLKYDLAVPASDGKLAELANLLGLSQGRLIVAGSTAQGEEKLLLDAFSTLIQQTDSSNVRLLLAPRHPERFDEVESLIRQRGLSFVRRSRIESRNDAHVSRIILLDTVGELASLYSTADVVFVGGSLVPVGGHNILEPALFGKPIVIGPYTSNFQAIVHEFNQEKALLQLAPPHHRAYHDQLVETLRWLLNDSAQSQALGNNARSLLERNKGATDRTLDYIRPFLQPTSIEAPSSAPRKP
jgi:3-deoxy-D-manno-octulosonic-acid transferase